MAPSAAQPRATTVPAHDLGVLFVHGIGNQTAGSTLTAFGTPLVDWLCARAARVGAEVHVGATTLVGADDEPATSSIVIASAQVGRRWLLAESWWAESFPAAPFRDVAEWSLLIVPWTIGTHFARRWTRARTYGYSGSRLASVAARIGAVAALVGALLLSPAVLLVLTLLLALGRIPWPQLQSAVAAIQRAIGSSLGDSYMLVTRPLEAAAIRTRLRRDLAWMARHCTKVAVVAHSQGGAIACQVLSTSESSGHLLLTFGSGLRKLEELDAARRRGGLLQGALLSVAGLVVAGLMLAAAPQIVYQAYEGSASPMSVVTLAVIGLVGVAVGIAGLQDFRHATEPARLDTLATLLTLKKVLWEDVYSGADPVSNGTVRDNGAAPPGSTEVTNTGSLLRDHTAYWQNRDEFVPLVAEMLLAFDGTGVIDPERAEDVSFRRAQRAARIGLSRALGWATPACLLALAVQYPREWFAVLAWLSHNMLAWTGGFVGYVPPAMASPDTGTWSRSVGWLVAVLAASRVTRALWGQWHSAAMHDAERGLPRIREPIGVLIGLFVQLLVAGVAIVTPGVAFAVAAVSTGVVLIGVGIGQRRHPVPAGNDGGLEEPVSSAIAVGRALWSLSQAGLMLVVVPLSFGAGAVRVHAFVAARFGDRVAWTAAGVVVVAGAVLFFAMVRGAWRAARPPAPR